MRRRLIAQRRHARDAHGTEALSASDAAGGEISRRLARSPRAMRSRMCARSWRWPRSMATTPVVRAMTDALAFEAFSSEYIAHLIEARAAPIARSEPAAAYAPAGCPGAGTAAG